MRVTRWSGFPTLTPCAVVSEPQRDFSGRCCLCVAVERKHCITIGWLWVVVKFEIVVKICHNQSSFTSYFQVAITVMGCSWGLLKCAKSLCSNKKLLVLLPQSSKISRCLPTNRLSLMDCTRAGATQWMGFSANNCPLSLECISWTPWYTSITHFEFDQALFI